MVAVYPIGIPGVFLLCLMARKSKLNVEVNEDATKYFIWCYLEVL